MIKLLLISFIASAQITKKEDAGFCFDKTVEVKICVLEKQDCYIYNGETIRCFKKVVKDGL